MLEYLLSYRVQPYPYVLSTAKVSRSPLAQHHRRPIARITAGTGRPVFQRKGAETAKLDAASLSYRLRYGFQHRVHGQLNVLARNSVVPRNKPLNKI
jgi:hypothetical protein